MTTVAEADNPRSIAEKASTVLENRAEVTVRAVAWLKAHDVEARDRFGRFVD
jgi:hypothetical protein